MIKAIAEESVEFQQCGCSRLLALIYRAPGGVTTSGIFTLYPSIPRYISQTFAGNPGIVRLFLDSKGVLVQLALIVICTFFPWPTLQVDFSEGSEQLEFVKDDLAAVDRCQFPWIILGGHRPMYIDSTYQGNPSADIVSLVNE